MARALPARHTPGVRLSRSRVLLRVVLLAVGGVVLLVRGVLLVHAPANAASARVGAVQLVVALLALVTAAGTAASLRKRRHDPTFRRPREPISEPPARKEEP